MKRFAALLAAFGGAGLLGAAPPPRALAGVQPGLWEVSRSAVGHGARRLCLRDMVELAHLPHAGESCRRTVLVDRDDLLVLDLVCAGGDSGRSTFSVTTPRSIKVESQGIHRGLPFAQSLFARRIGSCPRPTAAR